MVIQKIKIHNFRNVPDQDIDINGCNVLCYGDNGVGKSNLITAVHALLAAKFPDGSIRNGADSAEVEAVLADFVRGDDTETWIPVDGTEHKMRAVITKNKAGEQKVDIELHYPNGGADTQVTKVRSYIGQAPMQYNFVELSRTEKGRQEQLKILRGMFPVELQERLNQLENKIKLAEKDRLEAGRQLDATRGFIKKMGITEADVKKYAEPVDVSAISQQIQKAHEFNADRAKRTAERDEYLMLSTMFAQFIDELHDKKHVIIDGVNIGIKVTDKRSAFLRDSAVRAWSEIEKLIEVKIQAQMIEDMKAQAVELATKISGINQLLQTYTAINTYILQEQINEASHHNSMVEKVAEYRKALAELQDQENQYGEYDDLVKSTREAFRDTVRSFELPVPGLSFDDTTAMYNGKPADEENTSTAERMMIDAMLSISAMEKASILFMMRGESIGMENFRQLKQLCADNGIQLFLEQVERQESAELIVKVECQ